MLLKVHHKTQFEYSEPAWDNVNQLWLYPRRSPRQRIMQAILRVLPATRLHHYPDFFGNVVHRFEIKEKHPALTIELNALIDTREFFSYDRLPYGTPLSTLLNEEIREQYHAFLTESTYVQLLPETWREALDRRAEVSGDDLFHIACSLMTTLSEECTYQPGATDASTRSSEFSKTKKGVCQDYAHLLLAWLRCLGIPARYVSGYLFDPGHDHLYGAQASHAWVDFYLPGTGWVGLDPTNNKVVNGQYIVLAIGRDYDDISPVKGTFYGGGQHRHMKVTVHVTQH